MRSFLAVFVIFLEFPVQAEDYRPLPIIQTKNTAARILEVEAISSRVVSEIDNFGNFENRSVEIDLGITAIASLCETMKSFEFLSSQRRLESSFNPTDFYVRLNTVWKPGCTTGSLGKPQKLKLVLKYFIDQRRASQAGKPWEKPKFEYGENIRFISFLEGMDLGLYRWHLFELNYENLNAPSFKSVKSFSYVQGQTVNY